MEESKLTMLQRKTIQDAVDRGESLPPSTDRTKKDKNEDKDTIEDNRVNIDTILYYKETRHVIFGNLLLHIKYYIL